MKASRSYVAHLPPGCLCVATSPIPSLPPPGPFPWCSHPARNNLKPKVYSASHVWLEQWEQSPSPLDHMLVWKGGSDLSVHWATCLFGTVGATSHLPPGRRVWPPHLWQHLSIQRHVHDDAGPPALGCVSTPGGIRRALPVQHELLHRCRYRHRHTRYRFARSPGRDLMAVG